MPAQKTTPDQSRAILNAQPQIGYALVPLMVKLGIVNLEVLQVRPASSPSPFLLPHATLTKSDSGRKRW